MPRNADRLLVVLQSGRAESRFGKLDDSGPLSR